MYYPRRGYRSQRKKKNTKTISCNDLVQDKSGYWWRKTVPLMLNGKIELNLYLELKNQDREIHTESYIHTWPMFFYEFGGTVGFLLGYSVLSFFDKMVDFVTSLSK